ncbi:sigma factor G inhibitor Gin [Fredinandcohnia sp. 179-A 10B2 NHS]|uniref:sigma factor G inhibitor Gin n=1 Tax=Fredinandcohnia sp. 179-A 10B2 NHS TaxID=3235176 RepID=UPI0039A353AE
MEVEAVSSLANIKNIGETCIICEQEKHRGIHLYTRFICLDCEKDIIHTETNDPKYQYYLTKLKKVSTPEIYS